MKDYAHTLMQHGLTILKLACQELEGLHSIMVLSFQPTLTNINLFHFLQLKLSIKLYLVQWKKFCISGQFYLKSVIRKLYQRPSCAINKVQYLPKITQKSNTLQYAIILLEMPFKMIKSNLFTFLLKT